MKKTLIAFMSLVMLLPLGVVALRIFRQPKVWLSVSSPDKTYTVQLVGIKSRPITPVGENETGLNLFKRGELVVKNANVDSYDWFDPSFAEKYPEHSWDTESILRFGYKLSDSERGLDELTVSNVTTKPLRYLQINAGDTLFVFDVPPASKFKLLIPRPPADQSWIAVEGMFADGQVIPFDGVNFPFPDHRTVLLRYCVWIGESDMSIVSPVMEGYNSNATAEKPNIPKVENCDLKAARP